MNNQNYKLPDQQSFISELRRRLIYNREDYGTRWEALIILVLGHDWEELNAP